MMKQFKRNMGFIIGEKENEKRRALLPKDILKLRNTECLFFEKGYGNILNIPDEKYVELGCQMVTRKEILEKEIICEPKIGDATYLDHLKENQIIFGWIHAGEGSPRKQSLIAHKVIAYEWADLMEDSRHCLWKNNYLAGEAAILNAFQNFGKLPKHSKVAVIGRGNVAQGAIEILTDLGAETVIYNRQQEALLRRELSDYDVVVNAILWDKKRKDHIVYREDLMKMKTGAMIIDISCDEAGAIETSIPTTLERPTYVLDGVTHYVVDHTPSIFYKEATEIISEEISKYLDDLIENKPNSILDQAMITGKRNHESL
ncbi:N(5)-(carboxyethyl)ornithine synthase [Enterococcus rivorum]|uniref:N(5)-(Carboxyethyl)ornithine synthase n=1 Tax=Enterococcus rivorum TaxID=762845 RepID=A0A1E5KYV5_9ENTE|nr:N(5)-(carboxyethyl)ornithine synthase [Enterococcus rivorum]MBP2097628.1 N5-(carboxyethyl)ornithine synthase [Enterococcus rivorum]OEH83072.1 N(5)-(carboxyethyl)ornithine synthase [Enterococcus rivorum]